MNSSTRRDFPTPADPSSVKSWHDASSTAASNACRSWASCRSRPTIGESRRRGDARRRRARRGAASGTGSALPFSSSGATASASTASRTSRWVSLAEKDLAGRRVLLEPGGDVDGVARHERLPGGRVAGHDLAGVHADPHLDRDATVALELLVQRGEPFAHVDRRARGPQRVVLVELRDPEHGHHRVADVLLDRPTVALDRPAHRVEVARLHVAERLRIESLAERRRAGDIAEDDRDRLADLAGGCLGVSGDAHAGQNAKSSGLSRPQLGQVSIAERTAMTLPVNTRSRSQPDPPMLGCTPCHTSNRS